MNWERVLKIVVMVIMQEVYYKRYQIGSIAECLTQVSETLEIAWKEKKVAGYGMLRLTEHQRTSHVNHYQSLCSTTFFTVSTQPMARPATPQGISLDGHSSNL